LINVGSVPLTRTMGEAPQAAMAFTLSCMSLSPMLPVRHQ
jgi:hypothetical protein